MRFVIKLYHSLRSPAEPGTVRDLFSSSESFSSTQFLEPPERRRTFLDLFI
jgi:hypothetical protein